MSINFQTATVMRDAFEAQMKEAAKALKSIPGVGTGTMGLTPDHVKASPEYRAAKARYDWDWDNYRKFNGWYVRHFAKELRKARADKLASVNA